MDNAYLLLLLFGAIAFIIVTGSIFKWHPFISLLVASLLFGLLSGMRASTLLITISTGFGSLIGAIGLIVVFGSILGTILEDSGSVQQLGNRLQQRASGSPSLGIAFLGMVLGIPVFCDSGFIVLVSLAKSLAATSRISVPTMTLSLSGGLYTSHTLVPPTPGPVAAAGNFGVSGSLGLIILLGIVVSIPVVLIAHYYAKRIGPMLSYTHDDQRKDEGSGRGSVTTAVLLIMLPVLLIAAASITDLLQWRSPVADVILFTGNPMVALLLSVSLGLILFRSQGNVRPWIEKGIWQAGPILLLTGCGGAFGAVLKASALSEVISEWTQQHSLSGPGFLLAGFLISALFKTAQGSSTSAIVIVSALLSPLAMQAGFNGPLELSLLVIAIGAGAMTVSHANDSYFWVVSQFSGFDLRSAYRGMTVMTGLQGITALIMVLILYLALA